MTTPAERAKLDSIKERLEGLHREITARPTPKIADAIESDLRELVPLLPGQARQIEGLIAGLGLMTKMTEADKRLEADLIAEWNAIARAVRARRADRRQAKVNAREVAKVRAAACPECFVTHAGECA